MVDLISWIPPMRQQHKEVTIVADLTFLNICENCYYNCWTVLSIYGSVCMDQSKKPKHHALAKRGRTKRCH